MIELTEQQAAAIEQDGTSPPLIVNPLTKESFVLLRKDRFDAMQRWLAPLKRAWDNPEDDDLTRKPA